MSKSIKFDIIFNLIISVIVSFVGTFSLLFIGILIMQYADVSLYNKFISEYNSNNKFMVSFVFLLFSIFVINMIAIFIKRMDKITDYINDLSRNVKLVSSGNLEINIPIKSQNELGVLAKDINKMSESIKQFMEKERQWEENKNNLITNISHDLRTPLTSIIGFLSIIKNKKYNNEEELEHYSEIAYLKATELKILVDQLFEFTKISNYDSRLNIKNINVCELIEQVVVGFIPTFEENQMEYRVKAEDRKILVEADPILLARAFANIISNAIKYGKDGKVIEVNIENHDEKAKIDFINFGEKIDEKDINNIFDRMFRIEKKDNKIEGNGLGLAICKTIIDKHNGSISVKSNDEKTIFSIII
ncbi:sensor histidine kinase [Clostridium ihumii]|uniref:sensor histidine kinase n=1 Tax=Clostridium ihumii TaxID=1470356 RepID=UPI003D349E09